MLEILITIFWSYIGAGSVIALLCMANETLPRVARQNRIPTLTGTLIVIFLWPAVLIGMIQEIKRRF